MVDHSELVPGAVGTVRVKVIDPGHRATVIRIRRFGAEPVEMPVANEDIISVEPRPLAVGDRVRCTFGDDAGLTGEIAHIRNELAWVDFGDNGDDLKLLEDLERAP